MNVWECPTCTKLWVIAPYGTFSDFHWPGIADTDGGQCFGKPVVVDRPDVVAAHLIGGVQAVDAMRRVPASKAGFRSPVTRYGIIY